MATLNSTRPPTTARSTPPASFSARRAYSPSLVEGKFCELPVYGVLGTSPLPGAGTSGWTRRTRILRDDRAPRTPGTAQPADNRDEGQAAREEHSCHDHPPRGVGGGRQDTVVAHEQRGCLHPQRHTPDDGTRKHRDHR